VQILSEELLLRVCLALLLGLQQPVIGLFEALLPDGADGLLEMHDKLLRSPVCPYRDS